MLKKNISKMHSPFQPKQSPGFVQLSCPPDQTQNATHSEAVQADGGDERALTMTRLTRQLDCPAMSHAVPTHQLLVTVPTSVSAGCFRQFSHAVRTSCHLSLLGSSSSAPASILHTHNTRALLRLERTMNSFCH